MRRTGIFVAILAAAFTAPVWAQDATSSKGNVETATLAEFGIGGLQPLSDLQGEQVRGGAFVWVGSFSYALGRVDRDSARSFGAARGVSTSARRSGSIGGLSFRARSSGFAFGAAR